MEVEIKTSDNLLEAVRQKLGLSKRTKYRNVFQKKQYNNIIFLYTDNLKASILQEIPSHEIELKKERIDIKQKLIMEKLNEQGEIKAYSFLPSGLGHYDTKQELWNQIIRQASTSEKKYIYSKVKSIDVKEIKDLISELESTLLIVLGQEFFCICEGKIKNSPWLIRTPSPNEYNKFTHMAKDYERIYTHSRNDIFDGRIPYNKGEFNSLCNPYQLRTLLIFEENGIILGFIESEIKNIAATEKLTNSRIMSINKLFVVPEARRKKVATRLYEKVKEKAQKEKCDRIEVEVYNFTPEAKSFFEAQNLKVLSYQYEIKFPKS